MGQEKVGCIDESVIKAVGAFGGGIASTGRACGALLGGVALISSLYSRGNLAGHEDPRMWRVAFRLTRRFEEIAKVYGGIDCRDIARVDWSDGNAVREFHTNPESRRTICAKVVGDTAFALGELLAGETG